MTRERWVMDYDAQGRLYVENDWHREYPICPGPVVLWDRPEVVPEYVKESVAAEFLAGGCNYAGRRVSNWPTAQRRIES